MNLFKNKDKNKKTTFLKTQKLLHYCLTAVLPFCLAGCMGVYEGGFECPPGEGVGCKSISEVNEMVNQGLGYQGSGVRKSEPRDEYAEEVKDKVCGKGSSCPLAPDSLEIWYAPRAPWRESLRDESLRDESRGDKPPRNVTLLEV